MTLNAQICKTRKGNKKQSVRSASKVHTSIIIMAQSQPVDHHQGSNADRGGLLSAAVTGVSGASHQSVIWRLPLSYAGPTILPLVLPHGTLNALWHGMLAYLASR
jgi:hypothetical protein